MKKYKLLTVLLFSLVSLTLWGQTIKVTGKVVDSDNVPIENAKIATSTNQSTTTDSNGKFILNIPFNTANLIVVIKEGYTHSSKAIAAVNQNIEIDFTIHKVKEIESITFVGTARRSDLSSTKIKIENIVGPSLTGAESLLNTLPYVSTANELSSLYRVRGGNYDENLVYINGIEVHRPQSIRSSQQEGMSVINPDMISSLNFSAGGFEAAYGDKMSSVLDITYKKPLGFETSLEASLLGGALTLGYADKEQKFSGLIGARYRDLNLILNTLDGDTNFDPKYFDVQTFLQYEFNPQWRLSFLGSYASNDYEMVPKNREVEFGTLNRPIKLNVAYTGKEEDKYETLNGSLSLQFKPNNKLDFNLDTYAFHTKEQEYYHISSGYMISEINPETGNASTSLETGGQIDHGRNNLDMLIAGIQLKSKYKFNPNSILEGGIQYQQEDVRNLMNSWQVIDSTGYSIPRINVIPGELNDSDLILNYHLAANNKLNSNRFNGYLQYTTKFYMRDSARVLINIGARASYWDFNEEAIVSPRAQIAYKPAWEEIDMLFRFSTGLYYQAPTYKEARRLDGTMNENIKSQRSIHFILGNDFEFKMLKKRPFKLTTEVYYKKLDNLVPYYVDNVRIIYTGQNNSKGYAYGIDARLNGELFPDTESWLSVSYGRAKESIDGRGYIPRPSDPRLKVGLFFQDYMRAYPRLRANVNLVYASGLPNGAPLLSDPYKYQTTLSDYKRVDVGLIFVFVDHKLDLDFDSKFFDAFKHLSLGLDIFNIFDIKNTISNEWIRDINSNLSYAVPNKLTGRFFNVKLNARF